MNRFSLVVLGCVAVAAMSGCSNAAPPEVVREGAQAISDTTGMGLVSNAGSPAPGAGTLSVVTASQAGTAAANTALLAARDPNEMSALRSIALGVSSMAGVTSPTTIQAVAAHDRQAAASILSGANIEDHTPVYVIKVTGGPFTASRRAPGQAARQFAFLTVTVDAATKHLTDVGYVDDEPDLTRIGSSVVDLTTL